MFQTAIGALQTAIEARIEAIEVDLSGYKPEVDARFTALDDELSADLATVDTESQGRDEDLQTAIDAKNVSIVFKVLHKS